MENSGEGKVLLLLVVFLAGLLMRWVSQTKNFPSTDDSTLHFIQHHGLCTQSCTLYSMLCTLAGFKLAFSTVLILCLDPIAERIEENLMFSSLPLFSLSAFHSHWQKKIIRWLAWKIGGWNLGTGANFHWTLHCVEHYYTLFSVHHSWSDKCSHWSTPSQYNTPMLHREHWSTSQLQFLITCSVTGH